MPRHLISDAHEWINEIPTVPVHSAVPPFLQRPFWPLEATHVAMEGHPHVRPCPLVPSPVHPLKSSFPSTSFLNPRSGSIPPPSPFPSSDSATSSLSVPHPPPHPLPPPYPSSDPLISAAATAGSYPIFPNSTTSIFAPSSSSVIPHLLGVPPLTSTPSAAHPPSSLAPSSATISLAVSTSLTTTQIPSTASPAASSSPILYSSSIPSPLLPTPSLQAPSAPHIPQAPSNSNPLSHSVPASFKPSSAPKHHQPSYAQVARGPRGPGFVRSHASDIESFARLPRTGINIISGSREGLPSFSFVNSDLPKVEGLYSQALVMKFHGGRPSLETSHKEILSWGIEQPFSIGPLSSRSFLLRFQDEKDLLRVLS